MTEQERPDWVGECGILSLMTESRKFAIEVGMVLSPDLQYALERLQIKGWVTLIDVTPIAIEPQRLMRVFLVAQEAVDWFTCSEAAYRLHMDKVRA